MRVLVVTRRTHALNPRGLLARGRHPHRMTACLRTKWARSSRAQVTFIEFGIVVRPFQPRRVWIGSAFGGVTGSSPYWRFRSRAGSSVAGAVRRPHQRFPGFVAEPARYHPATRRLATADAPQAPASILAVDDCNSPQTDPSHRAQRRLGRAARPAPTCGTERQLPRRRAPSSTRSAATGRSPSTPRAAHSTRNAILLAPAEIGTRRRRLTAERLGRPRSSRRLAHARGIEPAPWLPPIPVTTATARARASPFAAASSTWRACSPTAACCTLLLGRMSSIRTSCGSLTTPAAISSHSIESRLLTYVDGRLRVEGMHAFLASRGIHLARRRRTTTPTETAYGLAQRKGRTVERAHSRRGAWPR